jgi:dTDP-4-dehydrorhamnose 3,5-epimerase
MDEVIKLSTGATIATLQRIYTPKGNVYHGLKVTDVGFNGFGEAYFSEVLPGVTKGWKCHKLMTINLVVPVGAIQFYLRSNNGQLSDSVCLGVECYKRLTVPPGVWVAFRGVGSKLNLLLNVANIPHDPNESISMPLDCYPLEG